MTGPAAAETVASLVTRITSPRSRSSRGEPLEERVCVRGEPDRERAARDLVADAVEDDDAARAAQRDEAREHVDERTCVVEGTRVQEVVAVEEVELAHALVEVRWRRAS